ncbi:LysR substrate-binding domain-containing protein [Pseudomonas coleopterorum]|uniref:LysR substrate-binding domain-containing protein n=1 Tax=Pseudomonas coleopterorum TaxID=1605838 RepID=UPI00177C4BDD|nr:LysR substrate-binding domain-containing protein [Pseudomonas coleopterorum]MBD8483518.1 LysR family transcriptional regulator [Pseudomonas coleopterorum]
MKRPFRRPGQLQVMENLRRKLPPLSSLIPFEAAARLQSFSRAAQELHLTQTAISRQIRSLEDNLGVQLFDRKSRGVFLTDSGESFRLTVTQALFDIARQAEKLREHQAAPSRVVLSSQLVEAFYLFMPALAGFHQQHPHIELKLHSTLVAIGEDSERFDVAVQTLGRASADHVLLFSAPDDVFPVCSPGYFKTIGKRMMLDDLPKCRLLHYEAPSQDFVVWDQWLQSVGAPFRVGRQGMSFNSFPVMMQAAVEGHGVALGWGMTTRQMLADGRLVRMLDKRFCMADALGVYKWHANPLSPAARLLVQWLQQLLLDSKPVVELELVSA